MEKIITDSDLQRMQLEKEHEDCVYDFGKHLNFNGLDIDQWLKNQSLEELLKNTK